MNNCENRGLGGGQGCGNRQRGNGNEGSFGRGQSCGQGMHKSCGEGQGKGKRRALFEEKYAQYMQTIDLPEFETDEDYNDWLSNTDVGKLHVENVNKIHCEVEQEIPWGGKRENAGRKQECIKKIPYSRRVSADLLEKLKKYASDNNMTETDALEKAISDLS